MDSKLSDILATARPSRRRRFLIGGGAVLCVAGLVAALGLREPEPQRYATEAAAVDDLVATITATGQVLGLNTVEVGAEVSGRVLEVHVDYNDPVEPGELLATIDPEQSRAAVQESQARLASAHAAVLQAQATRDEARAAKARAEEQSKEGLISRRDLEAAQAAAARAEAQVASARAESKLAAASLDSAKSRLEKTQIRAPIGGVVLARLVQPGQTVTAGFTTPVLFKLAQDLTQMQLHAFVDESDVGRVREGQTATFTVDAWPDRSFEAKVISVRNEPKIEQNVVSYEALLSVDNAEGLLRPGMTATATITVERKDDVVLIPNAALRFSPPSQGGPGGPGFRFGVGRRPARQAGKPLTGPKVWVLEKGMPKPVQVKTGSTDGSRTEVIEGLTAGAEVVIDLETEEAPK